MYAVSVRRLARSPLGFLQTVGRPSALAIGSYLCYHRFSYRGLSPHKFTPVPGVHKELTEAVERWRSRDLSNEAIKYLYVDGVIFSMRVARSIEKVPVLVAIGVTENGSKLVLGIQSGDKESAGSWREFFRDLKTRGLKGTEVRLGIMDGLSGLEKVFQEEFQQEVQRCQVHVARNVLTKTPQKI